MLDERLAEHALAGGAGAGDRLMGIAAGGVHDIERAARHVGDHDGAVGGFAFDDRRARKSVAFGSGHARAEIMLLQMPDDVAVFGVHQRHGAEARAAQEGVVELLVVHHQRALIGHEMLEGIDAVGLDHDRHLVEHLFRPRGHGHVEAVVAGRLLRFAPPVLIGREHRLAGIGNAEIHHQGGAAGERRFGAPLEIIGRHAAHEGEFKVRMRIDAARQHVAAAGVDGLGAGRRLEIGAQGHDLAVADQHVAAARVVVIDDGAATDEFHDVDLGPRACWGENSRAIYAFLKPAAANSPAGMAAAAA